MKVFQIFFITAVFVIFSTDTMSANNDRLLGVVADARSGEIGGQEVIKYLENEIQQGRTSYKELGSSPEEFEKIRTASCVKSIDYLKLEIMEAPVPLNEIFRLESTLLDCKMDYEQAKINPQEIRGLLDLGLAVLAKEAYLDYKETKSSVSLNQYRRYMRWSKLQPSEIGLQEPEALTLLLQVKE